MKNPISQEHAEELYQALQVMLDQVDYQNGACRQNEMVGAVLSPSCLTQVKDTLKKIRNTIVK